MSLFSLIIVGISLSMDAVCVSVSNGMKQRGKQGGKLRQGVLIAGIFGLFQGIMPLIGYSAGALVSDLFSRYSNLTVSAIFFFLGGKMIWDGLNPQPEETPSVSLGTLLIQGAATSVDALAVGLSLRILNLPVFSASAVIAGITFLMCLTAFFLGKKAGELLENKAGIIGGILLILIACKSLFQI